MDRYRSRSRSRSRSPRRKHKKHKHRHSKRERSRSRTRSRTPPPPRGIHINPNFGIPPPPSPQMGYSASQLLHQNNNLEAQVTQLKNALRAEQANHQMQVQRNLAIGQELRNLSIQRDNAEKRANEVMNDRRMMIDMKTEMANRIHNLEVAARQFREDAAQTERQFEAKNQDIRALTYQAEINHQQILALNERNAALKAKCEASVGQNRQLQEELDSKRVFVEGAQLSVKKAETDVQLANLEIQRLHRELEGYKHLESRGSIEKHDTQQILQRKEEELKVAKFKAAADLKTANERIEKLENQLRSEKPGEHDDLAIASMNSLIETIKQTYDIQMTRLEKEVADLKADRLNDHQHEPTAEQQEQDMVALPGYLQKTGKPEEDHDLMDSQEHSKMDGVLTTQATRPTRPVSGPPVDSPVKWHEQKFERQSSLFETATKIFEQGPTTSSTSYSESFYSEKVIFPSNGLKFGESSSSSSNANGEKMDSEQPKKSFLAQRIAQKEALPKPESSEKPEKPIFVEIEDGELDKTADSEPTAGILHIDEDLLLAEDGDLKISPNGNVELTEQELLDDN